MEKIITSKTSDECWEQFVLDRIIFNQREKAINNRLTGLDQFNLTALLCVADKKY